MVESARSAGPREDTPLTTRTRFQQVWFGAGLALVCPNIVELSQPFPTSPEGSGWEWLKNVVGQRGSDVGTF